MRMERKPRRPSIQPDFIAEIISGDWLLKPDGEPGKDRFIEGYRVMFDRRPLMWHTARRIRGYPGDFYGTAEVVQAIVARQEELNKTLDPNERDGTFDLEWDGHTLKEWYYEGNNRHPEPTVEKMRPDGLVHLPMWVWGPVNEWDCDVVIGPEPEVVPEYRYRFEFFDASGDLVHVTDTKNPDIAKDMIDFSAMKAGEMVEVTAFSVQEKGPVS